ncbi:MAG: hypothetical protein ETSY2_20710 [Candidatus Entotheonella gemina]|uniref:Uncharacterized protein n=1 Tax=Candidatus Entotheonella gemina TaxID=1429439 RepID=W4M6M8_9BACT|nr:MAG: hypothetical protein ETSY2_20710 [Candidatus Entotheonella gemina]
MRYKDPQSLAHLLVKFYERFYNCITITLANRCVVLYQLLMIKPALTHGYIMIRDGDLGASPGPTATVEVDFGPFYMEAHP